MSRPSDYDDGSGAPAPVTSPELGLTGWLRWFWRQLTSMRVALILLLLLAVAAIPGSLVPQRGADPNGVLQYEKDNPTLFKILDAFPIQAFDVYGSVWFSAIYLLLFISLIGCVLPRIKHHWQAWRGKPPKTPARLNRMAGFSQIRVTNTEATEDERLAFARSAVESAADILRRQRYRVEIQEATHRGVAEVSVSSERGYLRETGNLLFHTALVGVLVCVGLGSAFTFNGQRVLYEGESFVNQIIDYDSANSGRAFSSDTLEPFSLRLDDLDVNYITPDDEDASPNSIGQVREFIASMTLTDPEGNESAEEIRVNHPLRVHGSPIYLLANGYAPTIVIRNADGEVVFQESVPFIPQGADPNLTSLGVVKVLDGMTNDAGEETELGLRGFFYPTQTKLESGAYTSNYPDLENPVLTLDAFMGDTGVDNEFGIPQSVYSLETENMEQLTGRAIDKPSIELRPGESADLPRGLGTVTLEAVPRYASFDVMQNPFQIGILIFALLSLGGLLWSLFVPRRRVWVKAIPTKDGVVLQYAGLARGDDPALDRAVEEMREAHREVL
ncbi:cytochrome c biogenesis protein [Mycolicibacterium mucogenicum 261Sha1.1M5]|uniref:Cytochrome c biogenesis protein n=1 Tax=Leucobacter aridicollis TaxID=283878 RepID=A0A852QVH2_9MICO|nr:cytochrome c biogenesis protein ResB [Leucobacter aridicollis]MBL3683095.1 cytochrome c biogenesis protein ResB [Leucobacter aridicollis]NYD25321.1 cytochrome c biogenesis protein [Leucobacter aridicollis]RKQ89915.1 cytochrome c biogenesis protein [Mycolicibacterium mucogenicum 261Sha1.1M5]